MNQRTLVQVIAAVVVMVFTIGIWSMGGTVNAEWLRFYSIAVLVALAVLTLWERYIWRLPISQKIGSVPRDISGTWKGTLTSFWKNPETGQSPSPKTVYLVVRQTAVMVSIVLLTDESKSKSSLAKITVNDVFTSLTYMYLNRPDSRFEYKSRMHHGSTSLDISGQPPTRLRGRYWTDRDSRGELDFKEHRNHLIEDFDEGQNLFT